MTVLPAPAGEVDERAAEFILKKRDLGGWADADQAALDAWLDESFAHRTAYWRLEAAWERADRLDALRPLSQRGPAGPQPPRFRLPSKIAAAAALIVAIGAGVWSLPGREAQAVYETPVGAHERITLADGSRIELNTNSQLQLQKDSQKRIVKLLRGEAFFEIRHDAAHPFVVIAQGHRVTDLGTKFAVREQQGALRVSVIEGSARLDTNLGGGRQKAAVLLPGDVAVATAEHVSVTRKPVDALQTQLSWRRGVLVFHHAALAEVAAEYNRYNDRRIVIADPAISKLTISATLPTNDVDGFARMAMNFLGLRARKNGNEILITR